jgi:hypothetical protein
MVDVGEKAVVRRTAVAGGRVRMSPRTVELLREKALPKGDALNTARIAGVMAAKRTPDLIPLCHGLNLTSVDVAFEVGEGEIHIVGADHLRHVQGGGQGDGHGRDKATREDEGAGGGVKAYTAAEAGACNTLLAMMARVRLC